MATTGDAKFQRRDFPAGDVLTIQQILQFKMGPCTEKKSRRNSFGSYFSSKGTATKMKGNYWVVSEDALQVGDMDLTSVFSFKLPASSSSATTSNKRQLAKEFKKDGSFFEAVKHPLTYRTPYHVFTNAGHGGMYLTAISSKTVCWSSSHNTGNDLWILRKCNDKDESKDSDDDENVRANDCFFLESESHNNFFAANTSSSAIVLKNSGSMIQACVPSMAFAVKLGENKTKYRASDPPQENKIASLSIKDVADKKEKAPLFDLLPLELIVCILSFFQGCLDDDLSPYTNYDPTGGFSVKQSELQLKIDSRSIQQRRGAIRNLRNARETCRLFRSLASSLISGVKLVVTFNTQKKSHNNCLRTITNEFVNLSYLNLRHCDLLTNLDPLLTNHRIKIRNLNLGGCSRLDDEAVADVISHLPNLVHLNLACSIVTDR